MRIAIVLLTLLVLSTLAVANDPVAKPVAVAAKSTSLPVRLAGSAQAVRGTFNTSWSVTIEEARPDGVVRGRVTYAGRTCTAQDASFTGQFDGTTLTIPMPFGSDVRCQGIEFKLAQKDGSNRFEGEYQGMGANNYPFTLRLTLAPQ